ncbi:unnamed protein product [Rotaria sp. Silwood1]|nr:unnamed protein product [Rotaria sp. Silwood1]
MPIKENEVLTLEWHKILCHLIIKYKLLCIVIEHLDINTPIFDTIIGKGDEKSLANPNDLLYIYPLAGVIYVIRVLFERYVAKPIGRSLGIHDRVTRKTTRAMKTTTTVSNRCTSTDVNQTYKQEQIASSNNGSSLSIGHNSSVTPLAKFCESCWRFTFYLCSFIYGVVTLQHVSV